MIKQEFYEKLYEVFGGNVDNYDYEGKIEMIESILIEYQKDNENNRDI